MLLRVRVALPDRPGSLGQVARTLIYDQQGGTNQLSFSNLETNHGIDDGKFRFTPPAGTKILKP